jgi:hypothetical protein
MNADSSGTPNRSGRFSDAEAEHLARSYVAAYNDRNLGALLALMHPEIVSHPSPLFERHPVYNGHDGIRAWWNGMAATGRWYDVVVEEVRGIGADQWAIVGEICEKGETLSPWVVVFRVRDGLIAESRSYLSDRTLLTKLGVLRRRPRPRGR